MKSINHPNQQLTSVFSKIFLKIFLSRLLPPPKKKKKRTFQQIFLKSCSLKKYIPKKLFKKSLPQKTAFTIFFKKTAPSKNIFQKFFFLKLLPFQCFFSHFLFVQRELLKNKRKRKMFLILFVIKQQDFLN